ncbi:RNB-domain-containing protein [Clavulina sp. PMI_390]|nr:RNB-domain-containing protein [Clavulina sp. PMI_390]
MRRAISQSAGRIRINAVAPEASIASSSHHAKFIHTTTRHLASSSSSSKVPVDLSERAELPPELRNEMKLTLRKLVKAHDDGPNDPLWAHTPDRGIREMKQLRKEVKSGGKFSKRRPTSASRTESGDSWPDYLPALDASETSAIGDIRAGHYVMVQRHGDSIHGVVLGFQQQDRNLSAVILEATGSLQAFRLTDVAFFYRNFIPTDIIAQTGLENMPQNERQTNARIVVLKKLRKLISSTERAAADIQQRGEQLYHAYSYRTASSHGAPAFVPGKTPDTKEVKSSDGAAYAPSANPEDDFKWGKMTLTQAMRFIFGSQTTLRIHHALAMKSYLQANPVHFVIDGAVPNLLSSKAYYLRPRANIRNLLLMKDWILKDDPRVGAFVNKANAVLEYTRKLAVAMRDAPLTAVDLQDETEKQRLTFNKDDLEFIQFMKASMRRQRYVQSDPYGSLLPVLIKRIDGYGGDAQGRSLSGVLEGGNPLQERWVREPEHLPQAPSSSTAPISATARKESFREARINNVIHTLKHDASTPGEIFSLLKELGFYVPWDHIIAHGVDGTEVNRRGLEVPSAELGGKTRAEVIGEERAEVLVEQSAPVISGVGEERFALDDGLDAARVDFGDMPVYVVDEADAHELDDGLSVEPIPDSSDVWVHVHVADPTSLIHPRDVISREAERIGSTTYFLERVSPMLPPTLTHNRFSLGTAAAISETTGRRISQPVMTFSLRVNGETGQILESKTRVGMVKNFKIISYDSVDAALGKPVCELIDPLSPSGSLPRPVQQLDEATVKDLAILDRVGHRMLLERAKDPNVTTWTGFQSELQLLPSTPQPLPTIDPTSYTQTFFSGFPEARLLVRKPAPQSSARRNVAEFMIAAGTAAASFAMRQQGSTEHLQPMRPHHDAEKNVWEVLKLPQHDVPSARVPIIYRVSPRSTASDEDLAAFVAARDPHSLDIPLWLPFERRVIFGQGRYSAEPGLHTGMGSVHYAKVTSPLRRFTDLVNHWQIKATLRKELPGRGHGGPKEGGKWPAMFDKDTVTLLASEHTQAERMARRAGKSNTMGWVLTVLFRALNSPATTPEALYAKEVLRNLDAIIMSDPTKDIFTKICHQDVYIPALGLQANLITLDGAGGIGEQVKVQARGGTNDYVPRLFTTLV